MTARIRRGARAAPTKWTSKSEFALWLSRVIWGSSTLGPVSGCKSTITYDPEEQNTGSCTLESETASRLAFDVELSRSEHYGVGERPRVPAEKLSSEVNMQQSLDVEEYPVETIYSGCGVIGMKGRIYASTRKNPTFNDSTDWELIRPLTEEHGIGIGFSFREFVLPTSFLEVNGTPLRYGKARELRIPRAQGITKEERSAQIRRIMYEFLMDSRNSGVLVNIAPAKSRPSCPALNKHLCSMSGLVFFYFIYSFLR